MFNIKIISILTIIVFLFVGCDIATKEEDSKSTDKRNTLNDYSLGNETGFIQDYFYDFDEEIDANYLYYNAYITSGVNTINSPSLLNPYLDTLNFHTFPFYTVEIENQLDSVVSFLLSLTPENIDNYSTLYPLDETNTDTLNWCNEMLIEYEGDSVEVSFDYQILLSSVTGREVDTTFSPAVYESLISKKEVTFDIGWTNIKSLIWSNEDDRYKITTEDSATVMRATLCAGNCDSSFTDSTLDPCSEDDDTDCYDATYVIEDFTDVFDSLIYVGVIDTNRYSVDGLMLIDRSEWERYDIEYKSNDKPYVLETTFYYEQIKVPNDSPLYWINGDCNQNLIYDKKEIYHDWGSDWCPDSLETGEGTCEVVDTNGDGSLFDEVPCNCLGNWIVTDVTELNTAWIADNSADPNGDNWRDCGWDGYCPGHPDDTNGDENGTESNGEWDIFERFEENGRYDFDILTSTSEYFKDEGNWVFNEPAEFCVKGTDGECDSFDPFEDRNCNGKWDDAESVGCTDPGGCDNGNGIWDDDEAFIDTNSNGTWEEGELLHSISDRLGNFIVDYSDPENPVQKTEIDTNTTVTFYFGTIDNSVFITYNNFLDKFEIEEYHLEKFHDIDRKVTIYTNKIVEYPLPGVADEYHVTKTKWFQDISKTIWTVDVDNPEYGENYGYDYHLFKIAENGNIMKVVHPAFFYYYGFNYFFEDLELGSWRTELSREEVYIYSIGGMLRSGEYYYKDTTIVTPVADYRVEDLYEVEFDSSVVVPFKKVKYSLQGIDDTLCLNTSDMDFAVDPPWVSIDIEDNYMQNCPPYDTTLTNTFKIIKTKTITMFGSGLEFGLRNTIWLGTAGEGRPLGIVKDQLEIRWSEPYWEEYGSDWGVISRLELRSLRKSGPEFSRFLGIFQPTKYVSLKELGDEERFDNDPFIITPSFGVHRMRKPNE